MTGTCPRESAQGPKPDSARTLHGAPGPKSQSASQLKARLWLRLIALYHPNGTFKRQAKTLEPIGASTFLPLQICRTGPALPYPYDLPLSRSSMARELTDAALQ